MNKIQSWTNGVLTYLLITSTINGNLLDNILSFIEDNTYSNVTITYIHVVGTDNEHLDIEYKYKGDLCRWTFRANFTDKEIDSRETS